jgi:hypothetical protein
MGKIKDLFTSWKNFAHRYERHISSFALIAGFIIDSLTLRRIDFLAENLVLMSYIAVAGGCIFLINLINGEILRGRFFQFLHPWLAFFTQLTFGALFSSFTVFYLRSSSFAASGFFVAFLAALLIGNETFRKRYTQLGFQMSIFFIGVFFYSIFSLPVALGVMGSEVFVTSGVASLFIIFLFLFFLARCVPLLVARSRKIIWISIGSIFALTNVLYFTNVIPPIPLALKSAGVYHSVMRNEGGRYVVEYEEEGGLPFIPKPIVVHIVSGQPVYIYSAVFAPTKLQTTLSHHWEYYDTSLQKPKWVSVTRIPFSILGGRDGGYRSYSFKNLLKTGLWRVGIETDRGQLIGRVKFAVENVAETPALKTRTL